MTDLIKRLEAATGPLPGDIRESLMTARDVLDRKAEGCLEKEYRLLGTNLRQRRIIEAHAVAELGPQPDLRSGELRPWVDVLRWFHQTHGDLPAASLRAREAG